MQHKFTFKHMKALESIEEYAKHRIEKIAKYSLHKDLHVHFIFEAKRGLQKSEILIDAGKFHMSAKAEEEDLYSAIDKAVARIEKQLVKNKEKVQEHTHEGIKTGTKLDFEKLYDLASPLTFDIIKKADEN